MDIKITWYTELIFGLIGLWLIWMWIRPRTLEDYLSTKEREMEDTIRQSSKKAEEIFNKEVNKEIEMAFNNRGSEWMQGLLLAERLREGGYNLGQLSDYSLREGDLEDFWQGFDDYIGYCEERGIYED